MLGLTRNPLRYVLTVACLAIGALVIWLFHSAHGHFVDADRAKLGYLVACVVMASAVGSLHCRWILGAVVGAMVGFVLSFLVLIGQAAGEFRRGGSTEADAALRGGLNLLESQHVLRAGSR